jgi:pimeloyl-ACP methyl ester carboxylesterase
MDLLRVGLGDDQLTFLGYSYGTQLGATYAALFPNRVRALVLDGATNPNDYINRPLEEDFAQNRAFEIALERFFDWCDGPAAELCGFTQPDMTASESYVDLIDRREAEPLDIQGEIIDGSALISTTVGLLYSRSLWPVLADALAIAHTTTLGVPETDGPAAAELAATVRAVERETFDPFLDAFLVWVNTERRYTRNPAVIDAARDRFVAEAPITGAGYWVSEYASAYWRAEGVFRFTGPWAYSGTNPVLVVGTTYDPATPYDGAVAMTDQLGNASLLTLDGDGHTAAYGGNGVCIDDAVTAYFTDLTLPADGTVCAQEIDDPIGEGDGDGVTDTAKAIVRAGLSRSPRF